MTKISRKLGLICCLFIGPLQAFEWSFDIGVGLLFLGEDKNDYRRRVERFEDRTVIDVPDDIGGGVRLRTAFVFKQRYVFEIGTAYLTSTREVGFIQDTTNSLNARLVYYPIWAGFSYYFRDYSKRYNIAISLQSGLTLRQAEFEENGIPRTDVGVAGPHLSPGLRFLFRTNPRSNIYLEYRHLLILSSYFRNFPYFGLGIEYAVEFKGEKKEEEKKSEEGTPKDPEGKTPEKKENGQTKEKKPEDKKESIIPRIDLGPLDKKK